MSALHHGTTLLLCIAGTALTYLGMHVLVAPHLQPPPVDVPNIVGLTTEQAQGLMDPKGLLLVLDGERVPEGDKVLPNTLFDQHPLGGSRLHPGEKVHVSVARTPQVQKVPALLGQPLEAARHLLEEQGFRPGPVTEMPSPTVAAGLVLRTQPDSGAEVKRGDSVDLVVSKGNEQVNVPNLRGRRMTSAKQLLEQAGLLLGDQRKGVDDNAEDGVIIRQTPQAGTQAPKGQKVDIVINE